MPVHWTTLANIFWGCWHQSRLPSQSIATETLVMVPLLKKAKGKPSGPLSARTRFFLLKPHETWISSWNRRQRGHLGESQCLGGRWWQLNGPIEGRGVEWSRCWRGAGKVYLAWFWEKFLGRDVTFSSLASFSPPLTHPGGRLLRLLFLS